MRASTKVGRVLTRQLGPLPIYAWLGVALYLLIPTDLVHDGYPVVGWVDDALAIIVALFVFAPGH